MEALFTWTTFHIRIGDRCSAELEVNGCVPQGSVLGPLLFLPFMHDLASALKSPSFFLADDVNVIGFTGKEDLTATWGCPRLG